MLNGGEKAKIKSVVMAIKGMYPEILKVLDNPKFQKDQKGIDELFDCNNFPVFFIQFCRHGV